MDNLLKSFTEDCMRTEQSKFHAIRDSEGKSYSVNRLLHASLGLTTEVGEAVDPIKKSLFYGKPFDRTNVLEEVGDAMWYMAVLLDELDSSFEEAGSAVISKLRARYPEKYSNEDALSRDIPSERAILEENLKKDDRSTSIIHRQTHGHTSYRDTVTIDCLGLVYDIDPCTLDEGKLYVIGNIMDVPMSVWGNVTIRRPTKSGVEETVVCVVRVAYHTDINRTVLHLNR